MAVSDSSCRNRCNTICQISATEFKGKLSFLSRDNGTKAEIFLLDYSKNAVENQQFYSYSKYKAKGQFAAKIKGFLPKKPRFVRILCGSVGAQKKMN